MSGITLNEEFIVSITGNKSSKLYQLHDLDVSSSRIKRVESESFKKLINLKCLKLSNNLIKTLSFGAQDMSKLQCLDISENSLASLEFLEQLPNLEELHCDCNGLEAWQNYVAIFFCPNLMKINDKPTLKLATTLKAWKEQCWSLISSTWEKEFSNSEMKTEDDVKKVIVDLTNSVRAKKLALPGISAKFKEFLLKNLCKEWTQNRSSGDFRTKKTSQNTTQSREDGEREEKMEEEAEEEDEDSPKEDESDNLSTNDDGVCEPLEDYTPIFFNRSHFCDRKALKFKHVDDDPTDEITNVWQCAVEPNPQNPAETTGIVATCGGDCVCLLDCSTGLVIKRYKQAKEQFYCLAWTTLMLENEGTQRKTNILAVSGFNGRLKLLHPAQLVCYAEHGNGRPNRAVDDFYYSCLTFHPDRKTWLFCGSSDSTITLFDIGIPSGVLYATEIRQLLVFVTKPSSPVINLVFHESSSHLVAGTKKGCFAWKVEEKLIKTKGSLKRCEPSLELKLPWEQKFVDGLVLLNENYVACKCVGNGCIFVFNLTDALQRMNIEMSLLSWSQTDTDFINLGASNGIVACGDSNGDIWLYNLQPWFAGGCKPARQMFHPSRILAWPKCVLGSTKEERRMTDVLDKPTPLVVNDVSITSDGNYIIGVTDCNLVCVWKKLMYDKHH